MIKDFNTWLASKSENSNDVLFKELFDRFLPWKAKKAKTPTVSSNEDDPYGFNQPQSSQYSPTSLWQNWEKRQTAQTTPQNVNPAVPASVPRPQSQNYLHPDYLLGNGADSAPFLYLSNHQLYIGQRGQKQRHNNLIDNYSELLRRYNWGDKVDFYQPDWSQKWGMMNDEALLGRLANLHSNGNVFDTISFWDSNPKLEGSLTKPCIEAMLKKGVIDYKTEIHQNKMKPTSVGEYLSGNSTSNDDPEAARKAELARRLHLMSSAEKQSAMRELGLVGVQKQNAWAAAMRSHGIPSGSSHHFPTSEGTA